MLENSLSRRNFLKASGMVAAGGGASMMLAGCNPSSTDTPQASDKKKILRYGSANSKQGLDMQRANNSQSACVADSVCESLLRWTEDNELVTCLLKEIPTFESDTPTPAPTPAPEEPSNPASPVKEKKAKKKKAQLPNTGEELLVMPLMVMGASALTAAGLMKRKH